MRVNLCDPKPEDIREFASAVVGIAAEDHRKGYSLTRSGQELVEMTCSSYRRFHRLMASGLYNKTRLTLSVPEAERRSK